MRGQRKAAVRAICKVIWSRRFCHPELVGVVQKNSVNSDNSVNPSRSKDLFPQPTYSFSSRSANANPFSARLRLTLGRSNIQKTKNGG